MNEVVNNEAFRSVVNFLESNVPRSDVANIKNELKKDFVLGKSKSKVKKQKVKKRRNNLLSRKEKKKLGFYSFPRNSIKYKDIESIKEIWIDYISEMLELDKSVPDPTSKRWDHFTQTLYKADFNGSLLEVVRSKCPSYVGKKGICIMDTKNTLKIVSKDDIITTIPKKESVFDMYIRNVKLTLFGKHLCIRPAERSNKKFKNNFHPDL
ncbi:ribonuclease P protein subunit p29 [Zerene cesonia]|uniref:ribonuclease P protein subunit p29 n=1 Tax=Zerene cesonia TaxID=33412 RepID=UPI0018E57009|nr:ribonuclease P protein subunit p29 [Zerene cesonia]